MGASLFTGSSSVKRLASALPNRSSTPHSKFNSWQAAELESCRTRRREYYSATNSGWDMSARKQLLYVEDDVLAGSIWTTAMSAPSSRRGERRVEFLKATNTMNHRDTEQQRFACGPSSVTSCLRGSVVGFGLE